MLFLTYAAITFNASATVSSIFLLDTLGELPFRACRDGQLSAENWADKSSITLTDELTGESASELMKGYTVDTLAWRSLYYHCEYTAQESANLNA